jgi:hypothetical protein
MANQSLKNVLARPVDRAPIITITGDPGVGKTTLACLFPKAVVLRFEDGLEAIPEAKRPYSFPLARSFDEGYGYLYQLIEEEHPFKTLVIDSVTKMASLIEAEIIESDPKKPKSINQALGGYGAGLSASAERHRIFTEACQVLNERGIAVVYVAHSVTETIDPPDGAQPYTRYTLRMDRKAAAHYIDQPDAVAYVRVHTRFVTSEDKDKARAIADKKRMIVLHPTGAHVSKNRYGIEAPIEWADKNSNPLLPLIPFFAKQAKKK